MPRIQVYLPDALYERVKALGLPASELLQEAVRAELARLAALDATAAYVSDLEDDVGEPPPGAVARADAIARRVHHHHLTQAG